MLKFHGLVMRARFGVYDKDDNLIDQAESGEVPVFTVEQFEQYIAQAQAEVAQHNAAELEQHDAEE